MSQILRIGSLLRAMELAPPFLDEQRSPRLPTAGRTPVRVDSPTLRRLDWTNYFGISGRFAPESVDDLPRNTHPLLLRSYNKVVFKMAQLTVFVSERGRSL
jgi:hypothetical protein